MNYLKIKLKSEKMAYAIREYFPYTDKPFFKSLDDVLIDEDLQISLAHLFVKLYNDELTFLFNEVKKHEYIVPIKHISKKFTKINSIICKKISEILGIKVLDDYFEKNTIPRVDIRDEYTKELYDINLVVSNKYLDTSVIIFDCCCSTGIIFNKISEVVKSQNLYLTYGLRFNCTLLNNTNINCVEEYEFNSEYLDKKNPGFLVRIYNLFGNKNVEVDFRDNFSILIGENGYGKSTATRLALLALEHINSEIQEENANSEFIFPERDNLFSKQ